LLLPVPLLVLLLLLASALVQVLPLQLLPVLLLVTCVSKLAVNIPNATPSALPITPAMTDFTPQLFIISSCKSCSKTGCKFGKHVHIRPWEAKQAVENNVWACTSKLIKAVSSI
jgi:hypothetical protein